MMAGGAGAGGVIDIYLGCEIIGAALGPRLFNYLFVL